MLKFVFVSLLSLLPLAGSAQFFLSHSTQLRSLSIEVNGEWGVPPVAVLGSDDIVTLSFDEMSHDARRFTYRVTHCNADWTPSDLHEIDYLEGFNGQCIDEWEHSIATTQLYTRYSLSFPNADATLLLSGNYKVEIFDDACADAPLAEFRFSMVEPHVGISASVSGNTDYTFNEGEQQLSFVVDYQGYNIASPASEIFPVVYQNRRFDNAVTGLKPTYITGNSLEYVHNKGLIFNAGNEYRRFELVDPNTPSLNVEEVTVYGDEHHALLYIDKPRRTYSKYIDENGRYYVRTLEGYGSPIEADYVHVHFALDAPYTPDGCYYLFGEFANNAISPLTKLDYDAEEGYYHTSQLLKLGLYNYMYVWLSNDGGALNASLAEGDFYNTDNEYLIYIYNRPFGARYDKLIGVRAVSYSLEAN